MFTSINIKPVFFLNIYVYISVLHYATLIYYEEVCLGLFYAFYIYIL